jgi:hypothetical protein
MELNNETNSLRRIKQMKKNQLEGLELFIKKK